jgi:hypothetical protein
MGGVSVIAFVLLLAFAIDRVVAGILFMLSWSARWRKFCPDADEVPERLQKAAARKQKLVYFVVAAPFSVLLLYFVNSGVLSQFGMKSDSLDLFLTALIVMGGAERVSEFSNAFSTEGSKVVSEPPLQISGTLTLEEGTIRRLRGET